MRTVGILIVGALVASALTTGCASRMIPLGAASGGLITQTQDPALIRGALGRALADERFAVEAEQLGQIIARRDHRGVQLRIAVSYSPSQYRISYVDSTGLDFRVEEGTGRPMISRNYARYLDNLNAAIRRELDRPVLGAQPTALSVRKPRY